MAKARGAYTLAIVNRRDSHITFKVDGVLYTCTGRDIEMPVASTKAFYSQIVAGALLGLYISTLRGSRIREKVEGLLFDALAAHELQVEQVLNRNVLVVKNLQEITP